MKKDRHTFISRLFAEILPLNYVWLELESTEPINISPTADIDLLLPKKQVKPLLKIIENILNDKKYSITRSCNGYSIISKFHDGSFTRINVYDKVSEKGWVLLDNADIIGKSRINRSGIRTLCKEHFFELHFLRSCIRNTDIPQSVADIFSHQQFKSRSQVFGYISFKYRLIIHKLEELYTFNKHHRKSIMSYLKQMRSNSFFFRLLFGSRCTITRRKHMMQCHSLVLAFSGENPESVTHIQSVLKKYFAVKTIIMGMNAFSIFHKRVLEKKQYTLNNTLLKLYLNLRYLLFNKTILIKGDNTSRSKGSLDSNTEDQVIRIFIEDLKETKSANEKTDSYSNNIFYRLGINPNNYSIIRIDHIRLDHQNELLMKESVRAN